MAEVDIGKKGETWFVQQANNCDLLAHSPNNGDQNGWDFFIEHPQGLPGSIHSGLRLRSLVQVKTTSPKYNVPKLKLSALIKLAETPIPAFVLHLQHDGDSVVKSQLYHIGPEVVKFAALRKALHPTNNPDVALKESWANLHFRHVQDYHQVMIDVCREAGGYHLYTFTKIAQAESAGFDLRNAAASSGHVKFNDPVILAPTFLGRTVLKHDRFGLTTEQVDARLTVELSPFEKRDWKSADLVARVGDVTATLLNQTLEVHRDDAGAPVRLNITGDAVALDFDFVSGRSCLALKIDNVPRPIESLMHSLKWMMALHDKTSELLVRVNNETVINLGELSLEGHRNVFYHHWQFCKAISMAFQEQYGPSSCLTTFAEVADAIMSNIKTFLDMFDSSSVFVDEPWWDKGMPRHKHGTLVFKDHQISASSKLYVERAEVKDNGYMLHLSDAHIRAGSILSRTINSELAVAQTEEFDASSHFNM